MNKLKKVKEIAKKFCFLSEEAKEMLKNRPKLRTLTEITKILGLFAGASVGYDVGGPVGMLIGGGIGLGFHHTWLTLNQNYASARKRARARGDNLSFMDFLRG